jgi:hypothetical protein
MRQHGTDEPGWAVPRPVQRRAEGSAGAGGLSDVLLGLQRSAGNAAVAGRLGGPHHHSAVAPSVASVASMAFVQRCGPTPCNCSTDERADYAQQHPDEPAAPGVETAGAGHDLG